MRTINNLTFVDKEHFRTEIGKTVNYPPKSINNLTFERRGNSDTIETIETIGNIEDLKELESTCGNNLRHTHSNNLNNLNNLTYSH